MATIDYRGIGEWGLGETPPDPLPPDYGQMLADTDSFTAGNEPFYPTGDWEDVVWTGDHYPFVHCIIGTPPPEEASRLDHAFNVLSSNLWALVSGTGTLLVMEFAGDGVPFVAEAVEVIEPGMKGVSVRKRADGTLSLVYALTSGQVKRSIWNQGVGEEVVQILPGAGENVDHCFDRLGRMIVVVWASGGWGVRVGTLNSDGINYTFASGAMSILTTKSGGSIELLPDGRLSFIYVASDGTVRSVICKALAEDGTGVWE